MKKYAVKLYSYQLECNSVKAICSNKEKAFEMMATLFNTLLGWLPEEATDITYSITNEGWRRFVSFTPNKDTTVECLEDLRIGKRAHVEIFCVEFEEDALSSYCLEKENFFEEAFES